MLQIACLICVALLLPLPTRAEVMRQRLTIFAEPGRVECYHQAVAATEQLQIDYKVIHGGQGEAHINFNIMDPSRSLMIVELKQSENKHLLIAQQTGIYKICFDNTISSFNRKIVTFTLEVQAANHAELERQQLLQEMSTDYHFERSYTHMHDNIDKISVNMMRSRQFQDHIRTHEAKDRMLAESSLALVNYWSAAQLAAMIIVGLLQVFMLRSIFNTNGRFYMFWRNF
ncbi:CG31787 [Drosophila busckii]|uniref:CG31787 n=1 Tax=Drosophila busckii TaxID=30019 RepID=A0A0M4EH40_DROBS|nr:CG31787 [Drosophila busckii]